MTLAQAYTGGDPCGYHTKILDLAMCNSSYPNPK